MAVRSTLFALALWLALVDFYSNFANANLTIRPVDTVVLVNQTTYFNCSTSARNINAESVLWYHYPVNSPTRKDVYDEGNIMHEYKDRFRIEMSLDEGVFNLVAERPSLADAGRYECGDGRGHGDTALAELIVLDGYPSCKSNMNPEGVIGLSDCDLEPDEIQLTCNVTSYRGNIPPSLEWKVSGDRNSSSLVVCNRSDSCNLTLKSNLTLNSQSLVCQTMKARVQQYGCSVGPIKVTYAMSSKVTTVTTERNVLCSANNSQHCTYKWHNDKNEEISLNEDLGKQQPGDYKCEAECKMKHRNESCRFIAMEVYVKHPDDDSAVYANVFPILLILLILGIGIILGVYFYIRRKQRIKLKTPDPYAVDSCPLVPPVDPSPSLPIITDQGMVDKLTINQYFIDRGTSGAIYGPFRWKNKKCVIKQILYSPDKLTDERKAEITQLRDRCMDLDHPHLVKVFEVWFPLPALYALMECADGKSLDKILRPKEAPPPLEPFSIKVIRNWALQIADGMKYLHGENLVHRNLKAAHVLVMESADVLPNTLKIGSYTLAKEHDHSTVMSLKGTMAWMAPEYIRGEPFSTFSDVWSYGVTVWEILTRDVPFKKIRKETDLVRAAINKTLKLEIPESCPVQLRTMLTDCWNYEVNERPSFKEICDCLLNIAEESRLRYDESGFYQIRCLFNVI